MLKKWNCMLGVTFFPALSEIISRSGYGERELQVCGSGRGALAKAVLRRKEQFTGMICVCHEEGGKTRLRSFGRVFLKVIQ